MKFSDATRRRLMAESSQPAPRAAGARKLSFELTLYEAGHSVVNTVPRTQPLLSNDDSELIAQLALLIRKLRGSV